MYLIMIKPKKCWTGKDQILTGSNKHIHTTQDQQNKSFKLEPHQEINYFDTYMRNMCFQQHQITVWKLKTLIIWRVSCFISTETLNKPAYMI